MKYILKEEMNTFRNLPEIIESYISRIPENEFDVRRSNDAWTIREHIYHIVDVQKMLLERMRTLKKSPEPVIEPYFPEKETDLSHKYKDMHAAFIAYRALRKEQRRLIRGCKKDDFLRNAVHKEYKQYSIPIIVRHMIFHEFWHMHRIEEIWLTKDEYFR